jgi:hypothetical protein
MADTISREDFLVAISAPETQEFKLKSLGKSVKIAPASLVETHKILSDLSTIRDNPEDAEARAAWEASWIVACLVEPKITAKDARKLIESNNSDVRRLSAKCQAISSYSLSDEEEAAEEAENLDTAEEVPGTAPLG